MTGLLIWFAGMGTGETTDLEFGKFSYGRSLNLKVGARSELKKLRERLKFGLEGSKG
jgi:hypothetical protein